jgi:hypothetical protein
MMRAMTIAREYTRVLRRHLRCYAVWPPTLAVVPGDYGVFQGGVFNRLGNITTDFGVDYVTEDGGHQAEKFQYESSRSTSAGLSAAAEFSGVKAELDVALTDKSSFFVSVSEFDVERLQSPRHVALRLRAHAQWPRLRYYVVWQLYKGRDLLFFGSESGGATVKIRGDTTDIKLLQSVGKVGGSLEFATAGEVGVQIKGSEDEPAGFAVNLFRVKVVGAEPLITFGTGGEPDDDDPLDYLDADDDIDDDVETQA